MKIASPDILHKSDIGGIRVGIADEGELADAYEDIMARRPSAHAGRAGLGRRASRRW